MKSTLFFVVLLLQLYTTPVQAAYYQWVDEAGVTHFTDDPDSIPSRYQKRAKKLALPDEPAPARAAPGARAPAPLAAPEDAAPGRGSFGGHQERWWRDRFAALRDEERALSAALPAKKAKLTELRRKRVIYMRAQDREAVNTLDAEISVDELRISELQSRIAELDQQAAKAGVPAEWRQ